MENEKTWAQGEKGQLFVLTFLRERFLEGEEPQGPDQSASRFIGITMQVIVRLQPHHVRHEAFLFSLVLYVLAKCTEQLPHLGLLGAPQERA